MQKVLTKKSIKSAAVGIFLSFMLMMSSLSVASAQNGFINPGDNPTAVQAATGGDGSIRSLALKIVNFALGFLGVIAVIMIIYGGFLYVTAAGADDKIQEAKKIIMYSIIGIIIILVSFAIVNTVLSAATGASTT